MTTDQWTEVAVAYYEHIRRLSISEGLWFCAPVRDHVEGWAIPPSGLPGTFAVLVDGNPVESSAREMDQGMRDIFDRFAVPEEARLVFSFPLDLQQPHEISCSFSRGPGRRFNSYMWPGSFGTIATPAANMMRVVRSDNPEYFKLMGYTQYLHIQELIRRWLFPCKEPLRILDWGCGAARVLRYFMEHESMKPFGYDVDPVNIGWCRQTFPSGQFELIDPTGRSPAADEFFYVIYGISIFTHLGQASEHFWLEELHRIARPGALVVVTVHGELAFFKSINDIPTYSGFISDGFLNAGYCPDLTGADISRDLYLNVFHTVPYIHRVWSRYFQILDYIRGGSTAHQDYVVMVRRPIS